MTLSENVDENIAVTAKLDHPTAPRCQNCGSNDIEYDQNQGNSICISCGAVLEESAVVSEITFTELGNGSVTFQGQFVSAEKGRASSSSVFAGRRFGVNSAVSAEGLVQESREQTLENGRRRINRIGAVLHMSEQHMDQAFRWLKLALQHQFTRGRRATSVCAACLYIVCRLEKTPHMLLDF
jgi:transcription factor IIIB 90 kDa subunit